MRIDLDRYRKELDTLVRKKKISKTTAKTYYSCLNVLNKEIDNLNGSSVKNFLFSKIDSRNQFLKFTSAIRKYEKHVLGEDRGILFGEPEIELFSHFKKQGLPKGKEPKVSEKTALRKINALRNEKLKYALRLQIKSGLRISEIADLEKNDIEFVDGKIKIHVRRGKGDKSRDVNVIEDNYLYARLPQYIEKSNEGKLFYTTDSLRIRASRYGIESHDLRRLNARKRLSSEMNKGKKRADAKKIVQRELGHETTRVTDLYITKRRK